MNHKEHCATNLHRSGAGPPMAGGCWVQGQAVGWLIPYSDDIKGELPAYFGWRPLAKRRLKALMG